MDGGTYHTFVLLGDGECYEGSVWETALFAAHHKLDNFTVIVDRNRLCIMDETEKCVRLEPLSEKWKAFGWNCHVVDGHRYSEILPALDTVTRNKNGKPSVIIANSIKGKGISFMENRPDWHNKMPNQDEISKARQELAVNCIID
jgi:transketolase